MHTFWWQVFLTTAGMIAVINSVLVGSFVGLLLSAFTLPLWAGTSAGAVAFLMSVWASITAISGGNGSGCNTICPPRYQVNQDK